MSFVTERLGVAGQQLLPGDLVLSGSFTTRAMPLRPGQTAVATLGAFGVVQCEAAAA